MNPERMFVTDVKGLKLVGVHPMDNCAGRPCVIHNSTPHHMSTWPLSWRDDRALFERHCEHGVGHPDFDQFDFWNEMVAKYGEDSHWSTMGIHGCDGCCARD